MARFFIEKEQIQDNLVHITGEDVKHITRVLRLELGDRVTVCAGEGQDYLVKLTDFTKDQVTGEVLAVEPSQGEPRAKVILVQGLPKGDKLEYIIQKCTELGVAEIWPVVTQRTVVQLDDKKATQRQQRWQRVAIEAGKQAGRGVIPTIRQLQKWADLWSQIPEDALVILPWESEQGNSMKKLLDDADPTRAIYIIIGPEGGFDQKEVQEALQQGAHVVSLGSRILRTETAGMATLAMILYQFGDLG